MKKRPLLRWDKLKLRKKEQQSLGRLSGIRVSKPENGKFLRNKAGRSVVTGIYKGSRIKAYQAHNSQHAEFISEVAFLVPEIFPKVLDVSDRWVFAEWAEGEQEKVTQHSSIQLFGALYNIDLDRLPSPGFDYLEDYVVPRFLEACVLAGREGQFKQQIEDVLNHSGPKHFSHPDLTPANIIIRNGAPFSIDNELLSHGTLPLLDACNCAKSLKRAERAVFWETWISTWPPSESEIRNTRLAWLFREVGSCFISGDFSRCDNLFSLLETKPESCLKGLGFPLQ